MTVGATGILRALVTGATGGIGRATCFALLESARARGLRLLVAAAASRPGSTLDSLVAELASRGAEAHAVHGDLTDASACMGVADDAVRRCGGLDVLVSNAGIARGAPLATLDVADWDHVFAVDARATWLLARSARAALAGSRGTIVAVASVSAHYPFPGLGAYSPAKAALIMLCRQLAQEWAPTASASTRSLRASSARRSPNPSIATPSCSGGGRKRSPSGASGRRRMSLARSCSWRRPMQVTRRASTCGSTGGWAIACSPPIPGRPQKAEQT